MIEKKGAPVVNTAQVCNDPSEEHLWKLVADNNFVEIIALLTKRGVPHNDLGEKLFNYVEKALVEMRSKAAKSILLFLISSLEDKSESPPLLTLIGDLYLKEGNYNKARKYYGQLPLTFENIQKTFNTFIHIKDIDGLLTARNNVLDKLTDPTHVNKMHNLVHDVFVKVASDPIFKKTTIERYKTNLQHLQKIDPAIIENLKYTGSCDIKNFDPVATNCLKISSKTYVRNNKIWNMAKFRPSEIKLERQHLKERLHIALRCTTVEQLIELKDAISTDNPMFYKYQCYLIVNLDYWDSFMRVEDILPLTDCDFCIIIIDEKNLESDLTKVLIDDKKHTPTQLIHLTKEDSLYYKEYFNPLLNTCIQKINNNIRQYKKKLAELYPINFTKSIQDKIKNKDLRVLLQASIYSTFVQYAIRDVAAGFKKLGFEIFILIEKKEDAIGVRKDVCMKTLIDFRPDLIFTLNHLRFEMSWIPKSIPYVTWVQDEMPRMFSRQGAESISKLDFIYTAHPNWTKILVDHGYRENDIGELTLSVNETVFHPMHLTEKEIDKYSCDVSYVANCSTTTSQEIQKMIKSELPDFHDLIQKIYTVVCDIFSTGNCLYGFNDYMKIIVDQSKGKYTKLSHGNKIKLATTFWHIIGASIFRQQPLEWLSEAGYDLAIYGNGWDHHPKLAKHARGWIDNGVNLCKTFNASRINLSVHQTGNYSSRIFDGVASGGFFLMRYHPADFQSSGLFRMLDIDYEKIAFRSKDDLLKKMELYLSSPELKDTIFTPVRQQILKNYTYPNKIKTILGDVSDRLSNLVVSD